MTIKNRTLQENAAKNTISMAGNQTLKEALKLFKDNKYPETNTYLIVAIANEQYNVILFSELKKPILKMGYESLNLPLSDFPIPQASLIVPRDTKKSGGDILEWVRNNSESRVVVTDAENFIGLFVNPNRSGSSDLADNLSLLELCGELNELTQDPRSDYVPKVEPPTCPICNTQNFYGFDVEKKAYICPHCEGIIEE